jgi:hypothetical protein
LNRQWNRLRVHISAEPDVIRVGTGTSTVTTRESATAEALA